MPLYQTQVALSIKGDRIPKGTQIELSEQEAAHLDPADVIAVSPIVEAPEPEVVLADIPLADMTSAQLKARAKELEVSASGSAADIRERIELKLATPAPEPEVVLEDHILTDEDVTTHPDWFAPRPDGTVAQVGDTIQVPAEGDTTNS